MVVFCIDKSIYFCYYLNISSDLKIGHKKGGYMSEFDQEALDYFYEEMDCYYDENEQEEIFDGFDD